MSFFLGRNKSLILFTFAVLILTCATEAFCDNDIKQEMTAAVNAVRPALVRIHVVSASYDQGRESKVETGGSGVIISSEGYAVTNHHVAMDAERIFCTLADKREIEAKLVGTDPLADISVIKLVSQDGKPFPYADFADSSKLEVGDRVFAMGCPYSLSQSVTMGIVSNVELIMPDFISDSGFELEGEDVGSIVRWIGHDALIAPGNSGGPLINGEGKIVGINEIEFGLSGAIPSNLAKDVAEKLIKDGKVTRSWLGMEVQPLLSSSKLDKGILISGVLDGSPAKKAGLNSGDILFNLDGQDLVAIFKEQIPLFNQFVASLPVGKTVVAKVLRDGKEMSFALTTAERTKAMDKEHELRNWGICGSNITYLMQKEMELSSQNGVLITSVLPSGAAGSAKPALREDDVITEIGNEPVKDVAELRTISKKLTDGKEEQVPLLVKFTRKSKQYATVVKIGKKDESDGGADVLKAYLPIDTQVLTKELAEALGVPGKTGVRITQVFPKSSAEKAGLKVGDLILKLDGEDIPAEQIGDEEVLSSLIRQYDIGTTAELGIVRDGKPMKISVKLDASPKPAWDYPKYEDENFEFTARDIAFSDKIEGNVEEGESGVYVETVAEGSWACLGKLSPGDVITNIDGIAVNNISKLKQIMDDITKKQPKAVVLKVRRGIHTLFLEIKPGWNEPAS